MKLITRDTYRQNGLPILWTRDPIDVFEAVRAVWRENHPAQINGYLITPYIAGLVLRVYNGMMPRTRERFVNRPLPQLVIVALEIIG